MKIEYGLATFQGKKLIKEEIFKTEGEMLAKYLPWELEDRIKSNKAKAKLGYDNIMREARTRLHESIYE